MGIGKRLVDLAKANLNALLERAGGDSVDDLTDEELEAELERRRERKRRQEEERKAAERAAENARKRGPGPMPPPPKREPKSERRAPPTGTPPLTDKRLRELYAQLEVPYGAPFDDVKKSFRRLMRKYHPDLHIGNPTKHKTATQLTMTLTQAYNELEQHLVGGRRG